MSMVYLGLMGNSLVYLWVRWSGLLVILVFGFLILLVFIYWSIFLRDNWVLLLVLGFQWFSITRWFSGLLLFTAVQGFTVLLRPCSRV